MSEPPTSTPREFDPDWTIHPGEILKEELEARAKGLSMRTWARILYLEPLVLNGILDGSEPLTTDVAERLAFGLGTSAQLWLNLEQMFRTGLATGKTWLKADAP